jgi:hypothetical protein
MVYFKLMVLPIQTHTTLSSTPCLAIQFILPNKIMVGLKFKLCNLNYFYLQNCSIQINELAFLHFLLSQLMALISDSNFNAFIPCVFLSMSTHAL